MVRENLGSGAELCELIRGVVQWCGVTWDDAE